MCEGLLSGTDCIDRNMIKTRRLRSAILTSTHSRTVDLKPARLVWQEKTDLQFILSVEHGIRGVAAAGEHINNSFDRETGLKVYSLYSENPHVLSSEIRNLVSSIDCIIYDLPDVGSRYYTYISSAFLLLELCAELKKKFLIVDHPNPIGGCVFEGFGMEDDQLSFVSAYDIPVRYGLTSGELFSLYCREKNLLVDLEIIKMNHWNRDIVIGDKLPFMIPSPNLPNIEACLLYPGTCLFEGTEFSEGRGTARPFTSFSAPFINCERLLPYLDELDLSNLVLVPTYFIPQSSKYKGQLCEGFSIEIIGNDRANNSMSKYKAYVELRSLNEIIKLFERLVEIYPFAFAEDAEISNLSKTCINEDYLRNRGFNYSDLTREPLDINEVVNISDSNSPDSTQAINLRYSNSSSVKRNKFLAKLIGQNLIDNKFNYSYFKDKEERYITKYKERISDILIY